MLTSRRSSNGSCRSSRQSRRDWQDRAGATGPFHFLWDQYHWPPVFPGDPMKSSKLAIALLAVSVGLIGCGEEKKVEVKVAAPPPPPPSIEIKIGHVGPLTGGIAHLGKDNENGARLAIEEANAAKIKIDGKD